MLGGSKWWIMFSFLVHIIWIRELSLGSALYSLLRTVFCKCMVSFHPLVFHHCCFLKLVGRVVVSFSGFALYMFPFDGPEPRWPFGARNCSYVQDRQGQVRDYCKELDPEICYGLVGFVLGLSGMLFLVMYKWCVIHVSTLVMDNWRIDLYNGFIKTRWCCRMFVWKFGLDFERSVADVQYKYHLFYNLSVVKTNFVFFLGYLEAVT